MAPKGKGKDKPKVGRPPEYSTAEQLQVEIDRYFNEGVTIKKITIGRGAKQRQIEVPVPTISGLCLFLGFGSRHSFYDYGKKEEFMHTIARARLWIEKEYEEQLQIGNSHGAVFALKNMGWVDKMEIDQSVEDKRATAKELWPSLETLTRG